MKIPYLNIMENLIGQHTSCFFCGDEIEIKQGKNAPYAYCYTCKARILGNKQTHDFWKKRHEKSKTEAQISDRRLGQSLTDEERRVRHEETFGPEAELPPRGTGLVYGKEESEDQDQTEEPNPLEDQDQITTQELDMSESQEKKKDEEKEDKKEEDTDEKTPKDLDEKKSEEPTLSKVQDSIPEVQPKEKEKDQGADEEKSTHNGWG